MDYIILAYYILHTTLCVGVPLIDVESYLIYPVLDDVVWHTCRTMSSL